MQDSNPRTAFTCHPSPTTNPHAHHLSWIWHSGYLSRGQNQGVSQAGLSPRNSGGGGGGSPSKFTQVTGKIQFLAVTDLMSLIPSWLPAGMHFLFLEAAWIPSYRSSSIMQPACRIPHGSTCTFTILRARGKDFWGAIFRNLPTTFFRIPGTMGVTEVVFQ